MADDEAGGVVVQIRLVGLVGEAHRAGLAEGPGLRRVAEDEDRALLGIVGEEEGDAGLFEQA